MPTLLLFRHAKSNWDNSSLDDFNRPLAKRGLQSAPRMGAEIDRRGWLPDLALVSSAIRARQTWELASASWDPMPETRFERSLYMAPPAAILSSLRAVPQATACVILVGHNPGMEQTALSLAGPRSDSSALKNMHAKFPTAALARFEFSGKWADLAPGKATLTHFLRPRDIG